MSNAFWSLVGKERHHKDAIQDRHGVEEDRGENAQPIPGTEIIGIRQRGDDRSSDIEWSDHQHHESIDRQPSSWSAQPLAIRVRSIVARRTCTPGQNQKPSARKRGTTPRPRLPADSPIPVVRIARICGTSRRRRLSSQSSGCERPDGQNREQEDADSPRGWRGNSRAARATGKRTPRRSPRHRAIARVADLAWTAKGRQLSGWRSLLAARFSRLAVTQSIG